MDRLDSMAVLLSVVEHGSLSAASRAMHSPLPTVSRKIAELEAHLGVRLMTRTSRRILSQRPGRVMSRQHARFSSEWKKPNAVPQENMQRRRVI